MEDWKWFNIAKWVLLFTKYDIIKYKKRTKKNDQLQRNNFGII